MLKLYSVSDDSKTDRLNEQITSLNEEVEKYKNDIEKLNREKFDLDNCKTVEIKDLNEKLRMMEEERGREKEILRRGLKNATFILEIYFSS